MCLADIAFLVTRIWHSNIKTDNQLTQSDQIVNLLFLWLRNTYLSKIAEL